MSDARRYPNAAAFRQALTVRLEVAAEDTGWTLAQLQRYIAYDRLLERLYREDQHWILKGAAALLARDLGVRATIDVDVYRDAARDVAQAELRKAAARDLEDWFRFEVGPARDTAAAAALRLPVTAYIGRTSWVAFHLDLVGGESGMTAAPEEVSALVRVAMPQLEQQGYRAYPLVDHVADKVVATFGRYREVSAPSTRYKDLVDLVAIVLRAPIDADAQARALFFQAERRAIVLPDRFDVPDREAWQRGYEVEAGRSLLWTARTLVEALDVVRPFLDPLMNGGASGRWDPTSRTWVRAPQPSGEVNEVTPDREISARVSDARRRMRTLMERPRRRGGHSPDERTSGLQR